MTDFGRVVALLLLAAFGLGRGPAKIVLRTTSLWVLLRHAVAHISTSSTSLGVPLG